MCCKCYHTKLIEYIVASLCDDECVDTDVGAFNRNHVCWEVGSVFAYEVNRDECVCIMATAQYL